MLVSTFRGLGGRRRASPSSTIFASVGASISHHHASRGCWGTSTNNKGGVARRQCCPTFIGFQYSSSRGRRTNNAHHQSLVANNNKPSFLSTLQIMHQLRGGGDDIVSSRTSSSFTTNATTNNTDYEQCSSSSSWRRVYLAVGSNLGDRYQNIAIALSKLQQTQRNNNSILRVITTSYLRMTSPMYVTDQPSFLNGAVLIETTLSPLELLSLIKQVESDLGRNITNGPNDDSNSSTAPEQQQQRYGPRPVDLDILLYDGYEVINPNDGTAADTLDENHVVPNSLVLTITDKLEVPHPRMSEREFVLEPMCDLERIMMKKKEKYGRLGNTGGGGGIVHPIFNKTMSELLNSLLHQNNNNHATTSMSKEDEQAVRVLPLPRNRMLTFNRTLIMGILNVTPDSFSDGGSAYSNSSELAALHALQLMRDGADIIDVGGESTRPGANEMDVQIEMDRVIPVIKRIRQLSSDVPISIDTRHSTVAKAAIMAGADIVNDVSGGTHDGDMLSCVASLGVPMIIMHMRGNPRTMQSLTNYSSSSSNSNGRDDDDDNGVVSGVARELMQRSTAAELAGVPRWLQVVDPGIGFAKDMNGNLSLLRSVDTLRQSCDNLPLLFGPSRKGFIGNITGETNPKERDYGTIAACLASIQRSKNDCGGNACNILRVHNVKAVKQAVLVYEAIQNTNR